MNVSVETIFSLFPCDERVRRGHHESTFPKGSSWTSRVDVPYVVNLGTLPNRTRSVWYHVCWTTVWCSRRAAVPGFLWVLVAPPYTRACYCNACDLAAKDTTVWRVVNVLRFVSSRFGICALKVQSVPMCISIHSVNYVDPYGFARNHSRRGMN